MPHSVLVVDDDPLLAEMVGLHLSDAGYAVEYCADGAEAVGVCSTVQPDIVLLDVMLPGKDGISVCRGIRETSGVPIIMLTARTDKEDVIAGLEAGADDYIEKPFQPDILLARIKVRLRSTPAQAPAANGGNTKIGDLDIDIAAHAVRRGGELINLTPLEFDLLVALATQPQQVFTRDMLLEQVWGYQYKADTRLVNVHVQRLRSKVEHDPDNPRIVTTVRGVGYRAGEIF